MSATLTPVCRAKLDAVFAKLACPGAATAPHTSGAGDPGGLGVEPDAVAVAADTRTQAQRNHDGLQALCDLVLGSPRLGSHRGLPVTAIITMTLTELEHAAGVATTASGGTLPIADALTMAQRAHPVLVVVDHHGRALHLGRGTRLANADQRLALIATERGCSKPGCTVPADRCQVHHIRQWADDGATNIDNLTLACPSDHAHINPAPPGGSPPQAVTPTTGGTAPGPPPPTSTPPTPPRSTTATTPNASSTPTDTTTPTTAATVTAATATATAATTATATATTATTATTSHPDPHHDLVGTGARPPRAGRHQPPAQPDHHAHG